MFHVFFSSDFFCNQWWHSHNFCIKTFFSNFNLIFGMSAIRTISTKNNCTSSSHVRKCSKIKYFCENLANATSVYNFDGKLNNFFFCFSKVRWANKSKEDIYFDTNVSLLLILFSHFILFVFFITHVRHIYGNFMMGILFLKIEHLTKSSDTVTINEFLCFALVLSN